MPPEVIGDQYSVISARPKINAACALLSQQQNTSFPFNPTASAHYYFSDAKERRNTLREGGIRSASEVSVPILIMFTVLYE